LHISRIAAMAFGAAVLPWAIFVSAVAQAPPQLLSSPQQMEAEFKNCLANLGMVTNQNLTRAEAIKNLQEQAQAIQQQLATQHAEYEARLATALDWLKQAQAEKKP
jgi:hypothetical protein